jgi:hypothetical protein
MTIVQKPIRPWHIMNVMVSKAEKLLRKEHEEKRAKDTKKGFKGLPQKAFFFAFFAVLRVLCVTG